MRNRPSAPLRICFSRALPRLFPRQIILRQKKQRVYLEEICKFLNQIQIMYSVFDPSTYSSAITLKHFGKGFLRCVIAVNQFFQSRAGSYREKSSIVNIHSRILRKRTAIDTSSPLPFFDSCGKNCCNSAFAFLFVLHSDKSVWQNLR